MESNVHFNGLNKKERTQTHALCFSAKFLIGPFFFAKFGFKLYYIIMSIPFP